MPEQWRPVRGYEGAYKVCDSGYVESVERDVRGRENSRRHLKGKRLTPRVRPDGTLAVNLWSENSYRQIPIRRIVLDAFSGPQPRGYDAANINGDPNDNRLSNLQWQLDRRLRLIAGMHPVLPR